MGQLQLIFIPTWSKPIKINSKLVNVSLFTIFQGVDNKNRDVHNPDLIISAFNNDW